MLPGVLSKKNKSKKGNMETKNITYDKKNQVDISKIYFSLENHQAPYKIVQLVYSLMRTYGYCSKYVEALAYKIGISARHFQRSCRYLQMLGILIVIPQYNSIASKHINAANLYIINQKLFYQVFLGGADMSKRRSVQHVTLLKDRDINLVYLEGLTTTEGHSTSEIFEDRPAPAVVPGEITQKGEEGDSQQPKNDQPAGELPASASLFLETFTLNDILQLCRPREPEAIDKRRSRPVKPGFRRMGDLL